MEEEKEKKDKEEEPEKSEGEKGGYALSEAYPMVVTSSPALVGMAGGFVGGILFGLMQTVLAIMSGQEAKAPFEMFASLLVGRSALNAVNPTSVVVMTGIITHMALATFFGLVFGILTWAFSSTSWTSTTVVLLGLLYGTVLWLVNIYLIGAAFWPWFMETKPLNQFLAHTLGYGLPLGLIYGSKIQDFP